MAATQFIEELLQGFENPDEQIVSFIRSGTTTFGEGKILVEIFGLSGRTPLSLSEISREMQMTPARIKQLKDRALAKLRKQLISNVSNVPVPDRPINELRISSRACLRLHDANIETIGQLLEIREGDLMHKYGIGGKTRLEVKSALAFLGLSLKSYTTA